MRKNNLAVAAAMLAFSKSAERAAAESMRLIFTVNRVCQDVLPPMPPEVARRNERESWKRAQRLGKQG